MTFWSRGIIALPLLLACADSDVTSLEARRQPAPLGACAAIRTLPASHAIAPERLAARREAALDSLGVGVALFAAGWQMGNAVGDPERQDSDFYWLTGLEHVEEAWLVLTATDDGGHSARLYLPDGPDAPAGVSALSVTGPLDMRCLADAPNEMIALLRSDTLPADSLLLVSSTAAQHDSLWRVLYEAELWNYETAVWLMSALRAVKDAGEIALLDEVARISAAGLLEGMKVAAPGLLESDVANAFEQHVLGEGATRLAFGSIVASGTNALELHYMENADPLDAGELIVMDVGGERGRYAADVARTFPVSGTFTERQGELYELVLAALEDGIDAARAGGTMSGIDDAISARLAQSGDLCGDLTCDYYIAHAGGHYVGLDVHDGNSAGNWFLPLVPGVVLNVEPGIYIPAEGIGIRIEETVLVTAGDPVVLSVGAPLTVDDIEAALATP